MELEKELEQFRQEAQRLKAGRRSGSLPFPEALRAFAVRYAEHTVAAGGTVTDAGKKLGVSGLLAFTRKRGNLDRDGGRVREPTVPARRFSASPSSCERPRFLRRPCVGSSAPRC